MSVGRPSTAAETSYELPAVSLQQPEVMRMNMNGRDVVVVDADLFSQIIDEVQLLKMKLTHLTQVIQVSCYTPKYKLHGMCSKEVPNVDFVPPD